MFRRPTDITRTVTLFPSATPFRSMRRLMPERVRDAVDDVLDRLRPPGDGVPGAERVSQPGRENAGKPAPERQVEDDPPEAATRHRRRSEEHTSELQSLLRTSYAVLCLNKNKHKHKKHDTNTT